MKKIYLANNKGTVLVDEDDFIILNEYSWHLNRNNYAIDGTGKILMHRFIMQCPSGKEVDHVNHNGLDNRKSNLRICSRIENHRNTVKHKVNKTGFKGVSFRSDGNGFEAKIRINGKKLHLGSFEKVEDAARVYDTMARKLFGNYYLPSKVVSNQEEKIK